MISPDGDRIICDQSICDQQIKNNKWSRIKADNWFFPRNGGAFCPIHIPEWVTEWRAQLPPELEE